MLGSHHFLTRYYSWGLAVSHTKSVMLLKLQTALLTHRGALRVVSLQSLDGVKQLTRSDNVFQ